MHEHAAERLLRAQGRFLALVTRQPQEEWDDDEVQALWFFGRLALAPDRYGWSAQRMLELEALLPRVPNGSAAAVQRRGMAAFALSVLSATERLLEDPSAREARDRLDALGEDLSRARSVPDFVAVVRGAAVLFFQWAGAEPEVGSGGGGEDDLDAPGEGDEHVVAGLVAEELERLRARMDVSLYLRDARDALDDMDYARVRWLGLLSAALRPVDVPDRRDVEFLLHGMVTGSLGNYGVERRRPEWEPKRAALPPWVMDELRVATSLRVRVVLSQTVAPTRDALLMENALETIAEEMPVPRLELFHHLKRYLDTEHGALRDATSQAQKQAVTDRVARTLRRLADAQLAAVPARQPPPLDDPYELYQQKAGMLGGQEQTLRTRLDRAVDGLQYQPKPLRGAKAAAAADQIQLRTFGLYEEAVPRSTRVPPGYQETEAQRNAFTRVRRVRLPGQWLLAHVVDVASKTRQKVRMAHELHGVFLNRVSYTDEERRAFLRTLEQLQPASSIEERDQQPLHSLKTRGASVLFVTRLMQHAADSVTRQYAFALPLVHDAAFAGGVLAVLPGAVPVNVELGTQYPEQAQQLVLAEAMRRLKDLRMTVRLVRDHMPDGRVAAVGYALSYPEPGARKSLLFSYVQLAKSQGWRAGMVRVRVDSRALLGNANRSSTLGPSELLAEHQFTWLQEPGVWVSQRWLGQELRVSVLTRDGTALNELEARRSEQKTRELLASLVRSVHREREPDTPQEAAVRDASRVYTRAVFDLRPRPLPRAVWASMSELARSPSPDTVDEDYFEDARFMAWAGAEHAVRDVRPPWLARWLDANADANDELQELALALAPSKLALALGEGTRPLQLLDGFLEPVQRAHRDDGPVDWSTDALLAIVYVREVAALMVRETSSSEPALRFAVGVCDELLANGYLALALEDLVGVLSRALREDDARRDWLAEAMRLVLEQATEEAEFLGTVACARYLAGQLSLFDHGVVHRLAALRREYEELPLLRSLHDSVQLARSVLNVQLGLLESMVEEESSEGRELQQLRMLRAGVEDFESKRMLSTALRLASAVAEQDPDLLIVNAREAPLAPTRQLEPAHGLRAVARYLDHLREETRAVLSDVIK